MAEDWADDVEKYASKADDKAIAGIVRYCGIAVQEKDSSLVSLSDKIEVQAALKPEFMVWIEGELGRIRDMKNILIGALIVGAAVAGYLYYQSRQNTIEIRLPNVTIEKR